MTGRHLGAAAPDHAVIASTLEMSTMPFAFCSSINDWRSLAAFDAKRTERARRRFFRR